MDSAENEPHGLAPRESYIQVGDVRTRYWEAGEGEPSLLLIHGLGASLECWQYNLNALSQRHRTVALDVVWFGKTDKPRREVTADYFGEFITGFEDAVGIPRAVLVGNSMGGLIAVNAALQFPDRVAGLVLVNPAGFGHELAWWLRLRALLPVLKVARPSMRTYRFAMRQLVYDPSTVNDDLVRVFVEMASLPGALDAHQRVLRLGVDWRGVKPNIVDQIRGSAHAIRVPTLIIWGQQDRIVPVDHAEIARRCIPNARVHVFQRCGHVPMVEMPDEFNSLVAEFVGSEIVQRV